MLPFKKKLPAACSWYYYCCGTRAPQKSRLIYGSHGHTIGGWCTYVYIPYNIMNETPVRANNFDNERRWKCPARVAGGPQWNNNNNAFSPHQTPGGTSLTWDTSMRYTARCWCPKGLQGGVDKSAWQGRHNGQASHIICVYIHPYNI